VERIIPGFQAKSITTTSSNTTTTTAIHIPNNQTYPIIRPAPPVATPPPPSNINNNMIVNTNPYSVGTADLDPFSNITMPGAAHVIQPGWAGATPGVGSGNTGNLVGPNHPMFQGVDPRFPYASVPYNPGPDFLVPPPAFLPGFAPPQPRYDPTMPMFNANQSIEFGFDDPYGNTGLGPFPGRGNGGRGGRGNGRGGPGSGRNSQFRGEPNPDHLRPPGWY
jgi:hypothetical protein